MLRSGTSVGAHYREATQGRSTAEFISKMEGALQELDETGYWLDLLKETCTLPDPKLAPLIRETDELLLIFTSIVRNTKNRPVKPNPKPTH